MKKLTEEQKMKLYHNLAIFFPVMGLILQILVIAVPFTIYGMTQNWAYFILYVIAQIGIMPALLLICGVGGLIFSIIAIKKVRFAKRYIVTSVLSGLLSIFAVALFPAMLSMFFGIR